MKRCKLHTIFTLKALTAALWLVLASGMVSCADNGSPDEPEAPDTPLAELTLRVGALRSGDNRARSQSDEFEAPTFRHENIRFLRIIIVHPDGTVEHNRLLTFNGRTDQVSYTFKVTPGETKQIYIVGNEPISMESSLAGITVGSMFNKSMVEELMLSRATGVPLIDSFFSAFSCVSNTGLGAGVTGYGGSYDLIPAIGKWVLSLLMLTGRLEIFTVLVLLAPGFWRK